jgi:hypothetical protein
MRPSTLIRRVRRPVVAILAAGVLVATAGAYVKADTSHGGGGYGQNTPTAGNCNGLACPGYSRQGVSPSAAQPVRSYAEIDHSSDPPNYSVPVATDGFDHSGWSFVGDGCERCNGTVGPVAAGVAAPDRDACYVCGEGHDLSAA